jgi:hypothetical protein
LTAFYNAARAVRPNETPNSFIALKPEIPHASWIIEQLEERGSGNNVEIKTCVTYTMATSLDEMTENMMLAREMFFSRFTKEGTEIVEPILKEESRKVRTFESVEGGGDEDRGESLNWNWVENGRWT